MYNNNTNNLSLEDTCKNHMADNGLPCADPIIADEKIHRYSKDGRRDKRNEWYIAFSGTSLRGHQYLICTYGSWSTGIRYTYKSYDQSNTLSTEEQLEVQNHYATAKKIAEQKLKEIHEKAAKFAQKTWGESLLVPPSKDYLRYPEMKGIDPIGARFSPTINKEGCPSIIIPVMNTKEEIRSLQWIAVDEQGNVQKRFLAGGEKKGNFFIIGQPDKSNAIYIAEGWATGVSIHIATGEPVVIAYDSGNLYSVTENIKTKFPQKQIFITGDIDETGMRKANEAAQAYGCHAIFPKFPDNMQNASHGSVYTDFNDLHQACGLEEVKNQIKKAADLCTTQNARKHCSEKSLQKKDPCSAFSVSLLPPILREYVTSICEMTNAHPIMVTSAVLSMASAFMGKHALISEDIYFQNLYPNLWIINVADSGQFKSTALNKGANLALEKSKELGELTRKLRRELLLESDNQKMRDLKEEILTISLNDVVLPNKLTTEALLEHLSQGHSGVILTSEFGGWLLNLERNHNGDLKALFTELYDVPRSYRYKTRTQGDFTLNEPYISICGVSTLAWLKAHVKEEDFASGFFARFLIFAPPHEYVIPPALPTKQKKSDPQAEQAVRNIIENIDQMRRYTISSDAEVVFKELHNTIYKMTQLYSEKCREVLEAHTKRWSPYVLKLAMIMQLFIDQKSTVIDVQALHCAFNVLMASIESTALLIDGELGESEHQRKCRKVFEWIRNRINTKGSPVKRQDLLQSKQLDGGVKEYDEILKTLTEQGKIIYTESHPKNNSLYGLPQHTVEEIGEIKK